MKRERGARSHFRLEVRDRNGRIIDVRERHGHLLNKNLLEVLRGEVSSSSKSLVDILGNTDSIGASTEVAYDKVRIGTGAGAESPTDTALTTQTESDNATVSAAVTVAGDQAYFTVVGSIIPAVNRSYTEAGWSCGTGATDTLQYLMQREVFTAVPVTAGQTATATFTITFN